MVAPYHDEYEPMMVKIAMVATLWEDPKDGQLYILLIHEALYFGDRLQQTLLNPNQLRLHGLTVEEAPRQFDPKSSHLIHLPQGGISIPLHLDGVISTFPSLRPTWEEFNTLPHIKLTSDVPWDPHSAEYAEREENCVGCVCTRDEEMDSNGLDQPEADNLNCHICTVHSYFDLREITGITNDGDDLMNHLTDMVTQMRPEALQHLDGLAACMIGWINIAADDPTGDGLDSMKDATLYPLMERMRRVKGLLTQEQSSVLMPQILSKWWNCTMDTTARMMRTTTQAGIRNIYAPGERKLRQCLDHMRYLNLNGKWYSDTFFVKIILVRQNTCGQIFMNGLGFIIPFPLAMKGDASLSLDNFIQDVGIPQVLITDEAKEETLGTWLSTCQKYQIKME